MNATACYINQILNVSILLESGLTMLKKDSENYEGNDRYEGYCIDVLNVLASLCKFTYVISAVWNEAYGRQLTNGSWDGVIGSLMRGETDVGAVIATSTMERNEVVDYLPLFMFEGKGILIQKPHKIPPSWFSFLQPLTSRVWGYTCMALVIFSLAYWLITQISHPDIKSDASQTPVTLVHSAWSMMTTLLAQGASEQPINYSTRILSAVWWFFALIISASYTGNLAAFLTVSRLEETINSFDDLVAQSKMQYGFVLDTPTADFMQNAQPKVYQQIWKHCKDYPSQTVSNSSEGIARVKAGGYAFISSSVSLHQTIASDCDLQLVDGYTGVVGASFLVQKGSPYKEMLSKAIMSMQEHAMFDDIERRWWRNTLCRANTTVDVVALDVENLAGIFMMLAFGLATAFAVALIERILRIRGRPKINAEENRKNKDHTPCFECPYSFPPPPPNYNTRTSPRVQLPSLQPQQSQAITVVNAPEGNCPRCKIGNIVEKFSALGICCAVCLFPFGLICLFMLQEKKCSHCGYSW